MNVGKAVYGILSSTTAVTDIVSTNIFPEIAEQETATPFIVYQLQGVAPEDTHDGPSKLDEVRMEIICFSDSYNGAADLADKVRGALDRVSGTYNGVNVESVQFNNVDIEIEYDPRRYSQVTTYTFRIKRDNITIAAGTPVTGAKLGDLSDVDVAGVSDGQFIKYVAAQQEWQAADSTGGVTSLAALTDVNLTGLGSKDVINYNSTTGKWEPVDFLNVLYTNLKTGVSTTINDGANTNSALELGATTAKLKTGISEILITETSPGDIDFIVATDGSGTTAYTALNIDGSTSANEAILNIPVGTQLHIKSATHYAYLRYSGGANASLSLPTSSGTIARTADIALDSAVAANTAKISYTDASAVAANTAKTGITSGQASAITANTAKISYTDASAVAANTAKNTYPSADATKLAGIETSADVTDSTNVASAGALMAASAQLTGDLDTQANEIKTTTANGNIIVAPKGTGVLEVKGDTNSAAIILNCEANTHGVTIQSPAHSAGATYTLTLPTSAGTNGQALTTNGSGVLSFSDVAAGTKYHDRFQSNAAAFRSGATATVELYYTAKADGDGLAESASSDTPGAGNVINRKIYYSESAFADPDTGTWVEFTPAPADDATFATVKAALLEKLKVRTGGTVPISLKQTWSTGATANLLLDTYTGASVGYSLRKLRTAYTGYAVEVYNGSSYADIGFSNDELDTTALATHCGSSDGFVSKWYDQSGNSNTAAQTVTGSMPKIYDGATATVVTENGKPAVEFSGLFSLNMSTRLTQVQSNFSVRENITTGSTVDFLFGDTSTVDYHAGGTNRYLDTLYSSTDVRNGSNFVNGQTADFTAANTATSTSVLLSMIHLSNTARISQICQDRNKTNRSWNGTIQEIIIYESTQSTANRTGIENNVNTFYSIY
jgi:hypothetical protein